MDLVSEKIINDQMIAFLALRSTSHSISHIVESRKLIYGDAPFDRKSDVYELGKYHKQNQIIREEIGFPYRKSEKFKMYYPDWLLNIKEAEVANVAIVGSHHVFMAKVIKNKELTQQSQLHHVSNLSS